jgi:hypothetical protein
MEEKSMVRSAKNPRPLLTFAHPTRVTVRATKFKWLDSARHLDIASLEKAARAEVEVGEVETECCQHLVRVVIRKGMVTGLDVEPISKEARTPVTPELKKLLQVVKRKLQATRPPGPRFPIPVRQFFAAEEEEGGLGGITVITCIQICFLGWCIACCFNGDIAICGRLTIDGTSGPYREP